MIYSTIPQYDVAIQASRRGLACVLCTFEDIMEHAWIAESTQEMVDHLEAHRRVGDKVPEDITEAVWRDNAANYPKQAQGQSPH
jgi:hypothetical protein